jgi:hypothetical protein
MIQDLPKIPGYHVIGSGFDPFEMQVKASIFDHEDHGFNKTTTWSNPFHPEIQFVVPSSVKIQSKTGTESNVTVAYTRRAQFADVLGLKRIRQQMAGLGKKSRINHRFTMNHDKDIFKVEVENEISWYTLDLDPLLTFDPNLAAKFMNPQLAKKFETLPTTCQNANEKREYRKVIENWGTDLVMGGQFGGYFKVEINFPKDLLLDRTIGDIEEESKNVLKNSQDKWNYDPKTDRSLPSWFRNAIQFELVTSGFELPENGGKKSPWETFSEGLRKSSDALNFKLNPISMLLMRQPPKYACMNTAIKDYKDEMGAGNIVKKGENCFSNCFGKKVDEASIHQILGSCKHDNACYEKRIGNKATACVKKCYQ